MKKLIVSSAAVLGLGLFGLILSATVPATIQPIEPIMLQPETSQKQASRQAVRYITGYNYQRTKLDEDMSSRVFDQYLRALDPNRLYFTASDVEDMERYRDYMSEALQQADLDPAYDMFNLLARRISERKQYALGLLEEGFEFEADERYQPDRSEEPWAADSDELDEIWRKRVKADWLRLRLAEQDDEAVAETLTRRYENRHRRIQEFNSDDVFQLYMNAFARSVEPHTAYMSPRQSENFEINMRLSLEGIGALLERETEYTTILRVVPGGPADQDGRLQAGDRVLAVGQEDDDELTDVVGWRLDDVVDLIRGPKETTVTLEVLPAETGMEGPTKLIDIERNEVALEEQAASKDIIEVPGEEGTRKIGIIRVPVFYVDFAGRSSNKPNYRSSTRDVRNLINELEREGVDGIVVDLRNNGGGALSEATSMTGLFIDQGPVVQVRDRGGRINVEADREPGMAWDGPLAVVVNRSSASASEIFAAAIQDYGRGVVLGEPTYGKGTVQNLIDLDDLSTSDDRRLGQVRLTMAQFYRISGGSTQSKGVIPDITLPTAGDPEEYGESALDFALPWREIDPLEYDQLADLSGLLEQVRPLHSERLEEDEELKNLLEDLREWERLSDRDSVSLVESVRREEMEQREARLAGRDDNGDSDDVSEPDSAEEGHAMRPPDSTPEDQDDEPDVLLRESARILADLIGFDKETHLLAQRSTD